MVDDSNKDEGIDEDADTGLDQTIELSSKVLRDSSARTGKASGSTGSKSTTSSANSRIERVGSWIGPYKLLQEIGAGGMGSVFMAEQREPVSRRVALKIIKAGMDSEQVIARFEAERQALSMMEHPNIARVLDAGTTENGRPFFVMELVHGRPITSFCDKMKLDIESRLNLFCDVCNAVQHAHQKGIIHRDLKPSNILVTMHDNKPVPKVIDFGVAKATNQRLTEKTMFTQYGEVVGTLEYMSPEQAQMTDLNVDTRSDIYSLGVMLYELLTGNTPLTRIKARQAGYLQLLSRISEEEAPKPSSRLTETADKLDGIAAARGVDSKKLSSMLRGDLDWIVLKALEKDRTRRYDTANGFAADVQRYLNAEPIAARPPTGFYLLQKFAKRHRTAVVAATAIVLSLVAGTALATWQAVCARRAEAKVERQLDELQRTSEIEKRNEELEQEKTRKDEIRKATSLGQIRSAISRGQWTLGLQQIDEYLTEFQVLPLEISILKLGALDGLSRSNELESEILLLEKHPEADVFRPQLQLWRGYSFLATGSDGEDGKALIQAAIEGGLARDDRLFAEGLVADSLVDAVGKYESALQLSPFHSKARIQLIITLIMLGRYEQGQQQIQIARTLFSNDRRFLVVETVSHALANRTEETRSALAELKLQFPRKNIRDVAELIGLSRAITQQFKEYDRSGLFDWLKILPNGVALLQDKGMLAIPVPEFQKQQVFRAYGEFGANSFLNPLLPLMSDQNKHKTMVKSCRKAYKIHPDGMFKCFEAWSLYALGDYQNSSDAFDLAATSDGLFPEIKNQALYGAFATRFAMHKKKSNPELLREAIGFLEQYISGGFEQHRANPMFDACCDAGRWSLARDIADRMMLQGDSKEQWLELLADRAIERENYGIALSSCDEILREFPDSKIATKRQQVVDLIAAKYRDNSK